MSFRVVEARGLVKLYGATRALSGINARFESGQVTAVEGPNGSGKSTLLQLLCLMARPTRGQLLFGERDAHKHPALRAQIGVLAHAALVYPDLTGLENLQLAAQLYQLDDVQARVAAARERFDLGRFVERPTRTYSRGQLQRVALARALLHRPRLLLLDEPTTGLDKASAGRLTGAIAEERERGAIVVLVTHDSWLTDAVADARIRLFRGRLQAPEPAPSDTEGASQSVQP